MLSVCPLSMRVCRWAKSISIHGCNETQSAMDKGVEEHNKEC